jgi:hypothetical protein
MLQKTAEKLFALLFFCCTVWLFRKLNGQQAAEKYAAGPHRASRRPVRRVLQ